MSAARCLFHTATASSPGLSLGAPRSSVASGAGLEPGAPRRRALVQDIRNGHLDYDRMWCGALRSKIAAQPVHGVDIEVRARGMRQVRVHVERFRRSDALEDRQNGGGGSHVVTHTHVDQRRALDRLVELKWIIEGKRI